jgi:hypothetical protein
MHCTQSQPYVKMHAAPKAKSCGSVQKAQRIPEDMTPPVPPDIVVINKEVIRHIAIHPQFDVLGVCLTPSRPLYTAWPP